MIRDLQYKHKLWQVRSGKAPIMTPEEKPLVDPNTDGRGPCLAECLRQRSYIPALHVSGDVPAMMAVFGSPDSAFLCCSSAVSSSHQGLSKEQLLLQAAQSSHLHHEMRDHGRSVLLKHQAAVLAQLMYVAEYATETRA